MMVRLWALLSSMMLLLTRVSGFQLSARAFPKQFALFGTDPSIQEAVGGLLGSALRRAQTTIADNTYTSNLNQQPFSDNADSDTSNENLSMEESVDGLLKSSVTRAQSTLDEKKSHEASNQSLPPASETKASKKPPSPIYNGNPAITNTALAHSLWSTVLRPNIDSAIDATCGNGHDSVALAKMLFNDGSPQEDCSSQLLCIDIQQDACANTTAALTQAFDADILERVQVLQTSHAPLPRPKDSSSVGLIVYNLGWLPNSDKDAITKIDSTLASLVDALLTVRIGGMVSVVTYPKSNAEEDVAVRTFLEGAALLSSKTKTWQAFLEELDGHGSSAELNEWMATSMQRVVDEGDPKQTWRVSEHRKLGMDRAPILLTATRIK
jgi:hypothetical protein